MGWIARFASAAGVLAMAVLAYPDPSGFLNAAHAESTKRSERAGNSGGRDRAERGSDHGSRGSAARDGSDRAGSAAAASSGKKRSAAASKRKRDDRGRSSREQASQHARDKGRAPDPSRPSTPTVVGGPTPDRGETGSETPTVVAGPTPDPDETGSETPTVVAGPTPDPGEAEPETPSVVAGPTPDPDESDPETPSVVAEPTPDPGPSRPETPAVVAEPTPGPGEPEPDTPSVVAGPDPDQTEPPASPGVDQPVAGGPSSGPSAPPTAVASSEPERGPTSAPDASNGSGSGAREHAGRGDRGRDSTGSARQPIQALIDLLRMDVGPGKGGVRAPEPHALAKAAPEPPAVAETAPEAKAANAARAEPPQAASAPRIALSSGNGGPNYRQYEISALGVTAQSRQVLGALGFRILSERRSALLGNAIVAKLRTPASMTAQAALARARGVLPELTFDLAHLYRPTGERAPVRYAADMVGATPVGACDVSARIGLIDSGVANHPTLAKASITRRNFVARNAATNVAHGTAIASILVGDLPGSGPLAPGARLYSANVFAQDGAGLRADALAIIEALDWLYAERVPVVNLSLMGPSNELLEKAIAASASRGQVLVAAAGNDGPAAAPAYPAAYPGVIAVSAVDARGRPYSRNNRGAYVYVAAPGVDIWGADARGGQAFWTGTSFAAPFVTATVARDLSLGRTKDINDGRARLAAGARDLGAPGRDPIFGYGLLQVGGCGGATLSSKN